MKRLTEKDKCGLWITGECEEHYDEQPDGTCISFCCGKAIDRLAAYEDTKLTPEEVNALKIIQDISYRVSPAEMVRICRLAQAEKDGRLVVLDEKRKPLIWGDDAHNTILCPNCSHDLMGGFPEGESCETPIYQCPYCGQLIDDEKAVTRQEAEEALRKEEEHG